MKDGAVLCFSNLDWGYLRYRKQHLMERLSAHLPVVYVNPPRAVKWRSIASWNRLERPHPGLWVHHPVVLPGVRYWSRLKSLNDRIIASCLGPVLSGIGRREPLIAWIYSPHAWNFVRLLAPDVIVYDMADDYTVPSGASVRDTRESRELARLEMLERRLLSRADLVLAVSQPLRERALAFNSNVHLLPNGCDFAAYATQPGTSLEPGSRPRIGYVGTIAPRFDLDLVVSLARLRPEWIIELVGPVSPLVTLPADLPPNVVWTGEIPYDQVPAKIQSFDVAMLPLRNIPFSHRSSPIQVYDYLAAGKAVVSTPIEQFERLDQLVTLARDAQQFASAVDRHLVPASPEIERQRRRFAAENSWDRRVRDALDLLAPYLEPHRVHHAA